MKKKDDSLFSGFQQSIGEFLYNPLTNWQRFINPQFGIFNQFTGNPEDEEVESAVLTRVGSYGSQLSTILEANHVLIGLIGKLIDEGELNSSQIRALRRLEVLWENSQEVVSSHRPGINYREAERLIDYMAERLGERKNGKKISPRKS